MCVCVCVCVCLCAIRNPSLQDFNQLTGCYETWCKNYANNSIAFDLLALINGR